ncbi:hexose transporter [Vararia minispora EC-137]|uniref:Hexose transporter n=1 Tax=Vararia minispora EC-137 TaxID=1314806 RepID=A0ACB8QM18_9AGAM|nr:hexose transporter [Vararia minispora EC-137]
MAGGPAVSSGSQHYVNLIDTSKPWWKNRRLLALNAWIVLLLITSSTNGYDGSMMNGLQSLPTWESYFNYPTGGRLGLFNAIQNIGSLCAYPFAPYVADGLGRRTSIFLGACIMIVATSVQSAAQSFGMFIGARFLIGFGLTFAASAAPLLITEIAYPSQRGQATAMYNTLWYLGSIVAAWTTFGTFRLPTSWAWRIPSVLQGLPSVIQVFLIWFAPESPRWLMSKGREQQALKTLAYYHANGNEQDPLVEFEFEEIKAALRFDREVSSNVNWASLLKTPGNRRRLRIIIAIAFFSQWSGNGLVSFYLNKVMNAIGITDPTTQLLINGILNIYNFFIAIGAGLLVDKVGRRKLFITSTLGMVLFWTCQTICFSLFSQHGWASAGHAVIAFICASIAFTPLIVAYTVEILPYAIRAKGFVVFNFTVSLSLIFNQYVNPIALQNLGWRYYIVYICWLTFEAIFVYYFVVETKGRTLEETAALFDGEDAAQQVAHDAAIAAEVVPEKASSGGSVEEVTVIGKSA